VFGGITGEFYPCPLLAFTDILLVEMDVRF
jgi:hypothetical protein